jgi:hypothetical protein
MGISPPLFRVILRAPAASARVFGQSRRRYRAHGGRGLDALVHGIERGADGPHRILDGDQGSELHRRERGIADGFGGLKRDNFAAGTRPRRLNCHRAMGISNCRVSGRQSRRRYRAHGGRGLDALVHGIERGADGALQRLAHLSGASAEEELLRLEHSLVVATRRVGEVPGS